MTAPHDGEPTKKVVGRTTYHWCVSYKYWTFHSSKDCKRIKVTYLWRQSSQEGIIHRQGWFWLSSQQTPSCNDCPGLTTWPCPRVGNWPGNVSAHCCHLPKAMCRHVDHATHSLGDIVWLTNLWPFIPCNCLWTDSLVLWATTHYPQELLPKILKVSHVWMAEMATDDNGNIRSHINHLCFEVYALPF